MELLLSNCMASAILGKQEGNWITEKQFDKDSCSMLKEIPGSTTIMLNFVSFVYFEALETWVKTTHPLHVVEMMVCNIFMTM